MPDRPGQGADLRPAPLVSVVMPAYRAGATLPRAIVSVQAQTLTDWELLVVDDGSGDRTLEAARAFAGRDGRIRVFALDRNQGAAAARNIAIRAAQGRFIAFLDADDEWLPEKLARQTAFMAATKAAFSYTGFFRQTGRRRRTVRVPDRVDRERLLRGNVIGCLTAVYDRSLIGIVEMPPLRMRQDFATWLDILRRIDCAHGLTECLAIHHQGRATLSSNKLTAAAATWRLYREIEGLSRREAALALGGHLLRRLGN